MLKKTKKVVKYLLLCAVFAAVLLGAKNTCAAAVKEPAKVTFKAKPVKGTNNVKLTIDPTEDAEGYVIYTKSGAESKYIRIAVLKKNGTAKRTYTVKGLSNKSYQFKVRAYRMNGKKTVYGPYSSAQKATVEYYAITAVKPVTSVVFESKADGATEKKPYKFSISYDDFVADKIIRLKAVNEDGNIIAEDGNCPAHIDSEKLTFGAVRMGIARFKIFAYDSAEDADINSNPVAESEIITVRITNDRGKCPEDPETYAEIEFTKDGYAYFGQYFTSKVTDSSLISKLNGVKRDHATVKQGDTFYMYHDDRKAWYGASKMKWLVVEKTDKYAILMCTHGLLETGYRGSGACSSWKDSFVRAHINGYNKSGFKNIWSWDFFGIMFEEKSERVLMEQSYGGCKDKVLLPTKAMVEKLTVAQRSIMPTAFAEDNNIVTKVKGYWCMDINGTKATVVTNDGKIGTAETYLQDAYTIVPVIKVDLSLCDIIEK